MGSTVLQALGPTGFLVNVARGSLVDSAALIDALWEEHIAGAGLDVIEGEPAVPKEFLDLSRLVISPHVGGFSPEAMHAMIHKVRANLAAHFAGKPVPSLIPA